MKTSKKILATLVVAATFAFAGCEKEDNIMPIVPDTPDDDTVENIFVGTSWTGRMENTYYYEGIQMDITYDLYLDFLDSTNAELFHDMYVYVPAYPAASQTQNMTETFTYTFTKDSVLLNGSYIDDETGDTLYYSYPLVYDKEANTLTIDFDDPDMLEMMGTTVVVLSPVENPAKTTIPRPQTTNGKTSWKSVVGKIAHAIGL